jgi:hypothetical protein
MSMPDPATLLRAARAKIRARKRWAKGYFAFTARGRKCKATSPRAVCWCAWGALQAVSQGDGESRALWVLENQLVARMAMSAYNDAPTTTHADILALYDCAIAAAEQEPHK